MAEKFTNYLFKESMNKGTTLTVIDSAGIQSGRESSSVCQIHSLYITQDFDLVSSNPEEEAATISLFIVSENSQKEYMVANNVLILPNSSFYIEKT